MAAQLGSETFLGLYERERGFEPAVLDASGKLRSLRDIYFGASSTTLIWHAVLGKKLLFSASTAGNGRELWETDGTTLGTRMAVELAPGRDSAFVNSAVVVNSKMWFLTNARATGSELWTWDGTKATAIAPLLPKLTSVRNLSVAQGKLWFTAARTDQSSSLRALYVSDGTQAGTKRITDPAVLRLGSNPSVTRVGTRGIVFVAARGPLRSPLIDIYFTDGSIPPQNLTQFPSKGLVNLRVTTAVGSRVIFEHITTDPQNYLQFDFWSTDGARSGTQRLFRTLSIQKRETAIVGGTAYIDVGGTIYSSDGSVAGTRIARRFRKLIHAAQDGLVLEDTGGQRFFLDTAGVERKVALPAGILLRRGQTANGEALFASDAGLFAVRANGLRKIADLPGSPTRSSYPGLPMRVGNSLLLTASRYRDTRRVLTLDPRNASVGTTNVEQSGFDAPFVLFRGHLYGSAKQASIGTELVAHDPASMIRLRSYDIRKGALSSDPGSIVATSRRLYFVAHNGSERQLFTTASLRGAVDALPVKGRDLAVLRWGEKVLVLSGQATQQELWISEGTTSTTRKIMSAPRLTVGARRARDFLLLRYGSSSAEVFAVDESVRTTLLVNGVSSRTLLRSILFKGDYLFGTDNGLYASDGTRAGTKLLRGNRVTGIVNVGLERYAYMTSTSSQSFANTVTLTDGTQRGTRSFGASDIRELVVSGARWISMVSGSRQRSTTYLVDASRTPTRIERFAVDRRTSPASPPVLIGNSMFFGGEDAFYGREPFRIDGLGALAADAGSPCGRGTRAMRFESDPPKLGSSTRLRVGEAPAVSGLLLAIGGYDYEGVEGPDACRIYVDLARPVIFLPLAAKAGSFEATIPIPKDPALRGIELALQCFALQAKGIEATAAKLWQIGD